MKDQQDLGTILAADLLQLAVVAVAITLFVYLRAACGRQARFLVHLALAYAGVGVFYVFDMAISTFLANSTKTMPEAMTMTNVVGSTLSLLNTAFFFTAWYLMRDLRLEKVEDEENPVPTMSKPFAAGVIAALMAGIAGYIAMAGKLAENEQLRTLFVGIDAFLSTCVLLCIASEFAQMRVLRDAEEGSLFGSSKSHLLFRVFTVFLFLLWGVAQWGRLVWILSEKQWQMVAPYTGQWHQWSAMLKILCAGSGSILALHALPSVRWKHKQVPRRKRAT